MSKVSKNGHKVSVLEQSVKEYVPGKRFSGRDEEPEATRNGRKNSAEPVAATDTAKRSRRRFTLKDKERILRLADACANQEQVGALLRREGIYKCTLQRFISEREGAPLTADVVRPRKSIGEQEAEALQRRIALLERQNASLNTKLQKAEIVIDFQKKLSQLLGLEMQDPEPSSSVKL
jgi:transposase